MTFVSVTDTDGVVRRVNPFRVAKLLADTTKSETIVRLSSGFEFRTTTAIATLESSLETGMELVGA